MVWLIIVAMLALVVVAEVLREREPAFPPNTRRRNRMGGRVNVRRPANDSVPDVSVFAGAWHDPSDCSPASDSGSGSSDGCSDSSSSCD